MLTDHQKANIQKWVDALRSGKYSQTGAALKYVTSSGPSYCCLGVLADVFIAPKWLDSANTESQRTGPRHFKLESTGGPFSNSWFGRLPGEWFEGLTGLSDNDQDKLIAMNDRQNKSFNDIADQLEEWMTIR